MSKKSNKLKLKPSSRDKRRYFLVKGSNEKIEKIIIDYLGIFGFAKSSYMRINSKDFQGRTMGSCLTKYLDEIRAALSLEGIKIEKVSGTIKGLNN